MRTIRFETFGDPSVLEVVEVVAPVGDEKTALVRVMAAVVAAIIVMTRGQSAS